MDYLRLNNMKRGEILMEDAHKLLVGFDLSHEYSQIACYNYKTFEPESIFDPDYQEQYLIPTVLGVKTQSKDWVFGEEAIKLANLGEAYLVSDLLEIIASNEDITIYNVKFSGVDLLERFLRKCLTILKRIYPTQSILKIVFTIKNQSLVLRKTLSQALSNLGITEERLMIQSHTQSYLYYALSQRKELWMNDIGLFDFDEIGMNYSQISINRNTNPFIVGTKYKSFVDQLSYDMLNNKANIDKVRHLFEDITKTALHKQVVSTIYMTGKGFDGDWADDIIAHLCGGRRVFKGQNLYVRGACYAARELSFENKLKDFLFLTEDMLESGIYIKAYHNGKMMEVPLAKAGSPWYNYENSLNIILDNEQEIEIITRNLLGGNETRQIIVLSGIMNYPNKTTRVQVSTKFENGNTCIITVKDIGFGDFYPSSNRIWEILINLE